MIANALNKSYKEVISSKPTYMSLVNVDKTARSKSIGTILGYDLVLSVDGKRLMYMYRLEFRQIVGRPTEMFVLSSNVQILNEARL